MLARFSGFRNDAVRTTIKQLKSHLLDATIADQKRRKNHCIRSIVQLRSALRQRLPLDCWTRLIECHKGTCDSLRSQTRLRLEGKLNKLRRLSSADHLTSKNTIPPSRCVIIDDDQVDKDVEELLNLGPNFAPRPVFSTQARMSITSSLCKFGYSYSWKERIGATVPTLQETLRTSIPFARSHVHLPTYSTDLTFRLRDLADKVLQVFDKHRSANATDNMTPSERRGLGKALRSKSSLRFSVGDKCGGFVVMSQERDIALCEAALSDNTTYCLTTTKHYDRECRQLQETMRRILAPKLETSTLARLLPKHPNVPTFYQLVKTHKLEDFRKTGDTYAIKTRPIVSSCGGPADGLSWLLQRMLSPLLEHVPAHLKNVDHFLSRLNESRFSNCARLSYQSFDVSSLYTNVDTSTAVHACIELLRKYHKECQLYGLSIADVEELLLTAVNFNIFQFKNQLYRQTRGLAMGSRIAPLLAILFMDHLERPSVTSDVLLYARYIDDIFIVGKSRTALRRTFTKLNTMQPSITLTTEDPDIDGYVPFLNTKIKICEGMLSSMWYKKAASENILIHARSCHPRFMKLNVVKNAVSVAKKVTNTELPTVMSKVERILAENGYNLEDEHRTLCWRPYRCPGGVPLRIPFLSENFAKDVNRVVKKSSLDIQLVFIPPPTLRTLLTSSRLYESRCGRKNCTICEDEREICHLKGTVYKIQCASCSEIYVGESGRPLFKRIDEHLRALKNPSSYPDNPFSRHHTKRHTNQAAPALRVSILHRNLSDPVERKIKEALEIRELKPGINNRDELRAAMELISIL